MKSKNIFISVFFCICLVFFLLLDARLLRTDESSIKKISSIQKASEMLQYVSGGHVLGFKAGGIVIASSDHALRVEFVGAEFVLPEEERGEETKETLQDITQLNKLIYEDLWQGVTLVYEKHNSGIFRTET